MRFSLLLCLATNPHVLHAAHFLNRAPPESTPPPSLTNNPSCELVGLALETCNSLTPSFQALPATSQAHCLCYSGKLWAPNVFDAAVKYCAEFASTASAFAYPALQNLEGFCVDIGDVATNTQSTSTSAISTTGSASASVSGYSNGPCGVMNVLVNNCANQTPGFKDLQPSEKARCLCSTLGSFDNLVSSCYQVAKTQAPAQYTSATALKGLCAAAGGSLSSSSFTSPPHHITPPRTISSSPTETTVHRAITYTVLPTQVSHLPDNVSTRGEHYANS